MPKARKASPPETAALKHGLHLRESAALLCRRCACRERCPERREGDDVSCAIEESYIPARLEELTRALREAGHDPGLHRSLVQRAVFAEVRWARALRYVAMVGELKASLKKGDADLVLRDVARELPRLGTELSSSLADLNLTPAAMAKLEASKPATLHPLAAAILEVDEDRRRERAETLDAEFTTTDEQEGEVHGAQ